MLCLILNDVLYFKRKPLVLRQCLSCPPFPNCSQDLLNSLVSLETQMESMEEEILNSLTRCRFQHLLSEGSKMDNVKNLLQTMRKYLSGQNAAVREGMLADGSGQQQQQQMAKCLSQSMEVVETVKKVKATVEDEIRRVEAEGEKKEKEEEQQKAAEEKEQKEKEAEAKKKEAEEEKRKIAAAAAAAALDRKAAPVPAASADAAGAGAAAGGDSGSAFLTLTQQKLVEFESLYAKLATDKEAGTKKVKFELQKAVNTLVNSLANDPTEHRHKGS